MRPLISPMRELGAQIDYRPGGVSMTNQNFARLEYDRRMNAERVIFLLAKMDPNELRRLGIPGDDGSPEARMRQVQALDERIEELLDAHKRITQYQPTPSTRVPQTLGDHQYIRALRAGGLPERFVEDALHDLRVEG